MQLTPLRFPQRGSVDGRHAWYGLSSYTTHCGRFIISNYTAFEQDKQERGWQISTYGKTWRQWLNDTGLYTERFPTCREAIDALSDALQSSSLMNAEKPT